MRKIRMSLWFVALAVLASGPLTSQAAEASETVKIELQRETGKAVAELVTPRRVLGSQERFVSRSSKADITVFGESVSLYALGSRRSTFIGFDHDGNGKISAKEVEMVRGDSCVLSFSLGQGDDAVDVDLLLDNISIYSRGKTVSYFTASYTPAFCFRGKLGDQLIRLVDQDLSGTITQDGTDAISVGAGPGALPLGKIHRIGDKHYRIDVAEDGLSLSAEPVELDDLAMVKVPMDRDVLKTLVLIGKDMQVYDLARKGVVKIPAGEYRLSYGLLSGGRWEIPISPTRESPTYKIIGGKQNTLRLGKPLRLEYVASKRGDEVYVAPPIKVLGAGGEEYGFSFDAGGNLPAPKVSLYKGRRKVSSDSMGYG